MTAAVAAGTGAKTQAGLQTAQKPPDSEKQQTLIRSVEGVDSVPNGTDIQSQGA